MGPLHVRESNDRQDGTAASHLPPSAEVCPHLAMLPFFCLQREANNVLENHCICLCVLLVQAAQDRLAGIISRPLPWQHGRRARFPPPRPAAICPNLLFSASGQMRLCGCPFSMSLPRCASTHLREGDELRYNSACPSRPRVTDCHQRRTLLQAFAAALLRRMRPLNWQLDGRGSMS